MKSKNYNFFERGQTMVLVKTFKIFHLSILRKRGENNTFYDILEGKNVYLDNKNKKLKGSKNQNFSKGDSPWVLSKNWKFFLSFYLRQHKTGKCVVRYSIQENAFFDYKNKNLIKSKNEYFLKGLVHGFGQKFEHFLSFYSRQNRPE